MRKFFSVTFLIWFLMIGCLCAHGFGGSSASLREAVSCISSGSYDQAAALVEQACTLDDADRLGHKLLGVIYMHTGDLRQSSREFQKALEIAPDDWQLHYALAVVAIAQQNPGEAEKHLRSGEGCIEAKYEIALLRLYLDSLAGKPSSINAANVPDSSLATQVHAMRALRLGDHETARSLLERLLEGPAPRGFEEKRAPLVSFDPKKPIELPAGRLSWRPSDGREVATVSGTVTLKADAGSAAELSFVTFYVDDSFVAATNNEPFQYSWNTRRHTNGMHQIRIEARDRAGNVVTRKTVWVRVLNADPDVERGQDDEDYADVSRRLWEHIRLSESRKLAHYHLADLLHGNGERAAAEEHLQYALAYQPDFLDAQKRLNRLRGFDTRYAEFGERPSGLKRIALTFDDGPNERTVETLEVLSKLGIPATFFVVGFRAEAQPDLLNAILAGGHEIENHTYTHRHLPTLSLQDAQSELAKTAAIIRHMTGRESKCFRPPGGHTSDSVRQAAGQLGLTCVMWTVNCSPYEATSREALVSHVVGNASDGGIILMHNGEPVTNSALPGIVHALTAQGYEFVTISRLLAGAE